MECNSKTEVTYDIHIDLPFVGIVMQFLLPLWIQSIGTDHEV